VTHWCPSCERYFDEPGFCPFDGKPLTAISSDGATLPSIAMPAVDATTEVPPPTEVPPTEMPAPAPRYRALSASESTGAAIAAIKAKQSEYDRLVGQTLEGRYHIDRKLGEGGMGVVFAARHAVIERPLAIKVLKREVMRDTATIKRFVQEAKAASRIGHPNIVDVTDFGTTTDGLTYQVMEFVDGVTLGQALRKDGPFRASRAIRIAGQLARALGAAHTKGIVHRDLKPENIFLIDRDGRKDFVKIVDFGIAKVIPVGGAPVAEGPRLTRAGAVFGTPEYMAPEQAAGRGDTDGRVDVYALGIILYEMLTGRVPHRGDTTVRTLAMQMLDPIEPPSKVRPDAGIVPELEAVVMKALAKKREQRYATMADLLADLEAAAGAPLLEPVSASVTDTRGTEGRRASPSSGGAGAAAAGGRVFSLSPVPPGADVPAVVAVPTPRAGSEGGPGVVAVTPDLRGGQRFRGEPAFVRGQAGDVPAIAEPAPLPAPRPQRWPVALGLAIVLAGGGVAAALYVTRRDTAPVAAGPSDAAPVAVATPDAAIAIVAGPVDAAAAGTIPDAETIAAKKDGRTIAKRDGAVPAGVTLTPRGTVAIQVVTRPQGGSVYNGFTYAGTDQPTIEQAYGSRARIRCTLPGHDEGQVEVVFDGKTDAVLCEMKRIKRCVEGLHNPFDDCPDARPN
jgi:serine/threonine-protein kinase